MADDLNASFSVEQRGDQVVHWVHDRQTGKSHGIICPLEHSEFEVARPLLMDWLAAIRKTA